MRRRGRRRRGRGRRGKENVSKRKRSGKKVEALSLRRGGGADVEVFSFFRLFCFTIPDLSLPRHPNQTLPAQSEHRDVSVERDPSSIEPVAMLKSHERRILFLFSPLCYCCRFFRRRKKNDVRKEKKKFRLVAFRLSRAGSTRLIHHLSIPTATVNAPGGSLARRGGSARLCGRIVVDVDVVVEADAAAAAGVVVAGLCRLDEAALPPSSRAVTTVPPPPPRVTEEDNMRSHSRARCWRKEEKTQRGKRGEKGGLPLISSERPRKSRGEGDEESELSISPHFFLLFFLVEVQREVSLPFRQIPASFSLPSTEALSLVYYGLG